MERGSSESSKPHEDTEPNPVAAAALFAATARASLPIQPRFRRWYTILLSLLFFAAIILFLIGYQTTAAFELLEKPEATLLRVMARTLEVEGALHRASSMERWLFYFGDDLEEREQIESALSEGCQYEINPGSAARIALSYQVYLFQYGEASTAGDTINWIDRYIKLPVAGTAARAIQWAYTGKQATPIEPHHIKSTLSLLPPGWFRDHAAFHFARVSGDFVQMETIRERIDHRSIRLLAITRLLLAMYAAIVVGGLFLWIGLRNPNRDLATGITQPSWTLGEGYAVMIRAAAYGLLLLIPFSYLSSRFLPISTGESLIAALPMLWLIRRHLLRPRGIPFKQAFGMVPRPGLITIMLLSSFALFSIETFGTIVISGVMDAFSMIPHWSDEVLEPLLWKRWPSVFATLLDVVILAPIVEEIAFRGIIYPSLRTRFRPIAAALMSGILFAGLHGYSPVSFLVLAWGGVVSALWYERTRSLVPCILSHACWNAFASLEFILTYRLN